MQDWFKKTFRILNWAPAYNSQKLWGDLKAGLTTGSMLIAQGMAYAVILGVQPIYGLYAGVFPLLVYPLLGTSRNLAVGPVAVDMLIVSAGVSLLAASNTRQYLTLVILLTMMTGLLELLMGTLRLGSVFKVFSRPVIAGFVTAAPIIIACTQLGHLLGTNLPDTQHVVIIANNVLHHLGAIHLPTFYWGAAAITGLILLKVYAPKLPGAVIILAIGIFVAWLINIPQTNIDIVGTIPHGLPGFSLPQISLHNVQRLLPTAFTLALVEFMSVASLSKAFAKRHNYRVDTNHELVAIGASNFVGSLFSTLPISGSFSRSAAADQAGGKTALANWVTASVILLTIFFLTGVFYYLPMPVLAAIIIVAVSGLIDFKEMKHIYSIKKVDGVIAVFTFLCTLFIGIQWGILLGIAASLLALLYTYSQPSADELTPKLSNSISTRRKTEETEQSEGMLVLRINAAFSFLNADYVEDYITEKARPKAKELNYIILDCSSINSIDSTATDSLRSTIETLQNWDIELYFAGINKKVYDVMNKAGLRGDEGTVHLSKNMEEAVHEVQTKMDQTGAARMQKTANN